MDITLSRDSYSITNATIELTPELHLVLRFRRRFDANFEPGKLQVGEALDAGSEPFPQ